MTDDESLDVPERAGRNGNIPVVPRQPLVSQKSILEKPPNRRQLAGKFDEIIPVLNAHSQGLQYLDGKVIALRTEFDKEAALLKAFRAMTFRQKVAWFFR